LLKDAASQAIYGQSASNGVVLITTKKSNTGGLWKPVPEGKPWFNVEFNTQFSVETVAKRLKFLSASQIRDFAQVIFAKEKLIHPDYTIDSVFHDGGSNTDWQKEVTRTGFATRNRLSLSAGNRHGSLLAAFSRNDNSGVLKGTSKHQTTGHLNGTLKAWHDRVNVSLNLMGATENSDYENYNGWVKTDVLYQAYSRNPTDPVYNSDGSFYDYPREYMYVNPLRIIKQITNKGNADHFAGNLFTTAEVVKGLTVGLNLAYTFDGSYSDFYMPAGFYQLSDSAVTVNEKQTSGQKLIEATVGYKKVFGKAHSLEILAEYSYQDETWKYRNFRSPGEEVSFGEGIQKMGVFARILYNFKKRYYVSVSFRRDGCSKFVKDSMYGNFPSVSVGWDIANERFMENVKWMNMLKIRAGYGITGNDKAGNTHDGMFFPGLDGNPDHGQFSARYDPFDYNKLGLTWEKSAEWDAGIDFAFLGQRLSGSIDYYSRTTSDLYMYVPQPIPPNLSGYRYDNSGEMTSKGMELTLRALILDKKNVSWGVLFTASHNTSKFTSIGSSNTPFIRSGYIDGRGISGDEYYVTVIKAGEEVGGFYLPTYMGLHDGMFVYLSQNGYTSSVAAALRSIDGSPAPKYVMGLTSMLNFLGHWSVDVSLRCWLGNHVYNATRMIFDSPGTLPSLNTFPEALDWYDQGRLNGPQIADIYVEDASFLKLDMLRVGYDFKFENVKWIQSLSLYAAANNLFTITGYKGIDPEFYQTGFSFGIDNSNVYPTSRSYTVGLTARF
jgi:TonB-dependent starch-binding outer membrane protein SusC